MFTIKNLLSLVVVVVVIICSHCLVVGAVNQDDIKPITPNLHVHQHPHDDHDARVRRFLKQGDLKSRRIAIVGGGVGGTSSAYFLHKLLGTDAEITLFEKESVGGRTRSVNVCAGKSAELGGSIIHPVNDHINNLVKELHLETVRVEDGETFAIWNGHDIVFQQSSLFSFIDVLKLLYTYHLDPITFNGLRNNVVERFLSSYKDNEPFNSVEEFFTRIGLPNITSVTAEEYFTTAGIGKPFVENILSAAIRVNYNQDYDKIAAFAAMIALVGSEDGLYSIKGGNYLLSKTLLERSKAAVLQRNVKYIKKVDQASDNNENSPSSIFEIGVDDSNGQQTYEFDTVIIAAPLELSKIHLENMDPTLADRIPSFQFQTVHTYLIGANSINQNYINQPIGANIQNVLTSHNSSIPFFVAAKNPAGKCEDGRQVYKVFSRNSIDDSVFSSLFINHTLHVKHEWKAYPVLRPTSVFPPIKLDNELYYVNAFEHACSTMETEVLASKNVARLIAKSLNKQHN
ncbi:hypothetical protein SAMD00019534_095500, partial [Acytostelium subglobosum LB1]|uniref:hypothetical protein n=1 Tax=Acytostelium subglobosum LB1 TaxID=1410327 RepID=UPI000644F1A5